MTIVFKIFTTTSNEEFDHASLTCHVVHLKTIHSHLCY